MFEPLFRLFRRRGDAKGARVPDGVRLYVIGDVHGRRDLLEELVRAIEEDDRKGAKAETSIIFLGDLIDRGPDSAGVIQLALLWTEYRKVRFLLGNHEEMFLAAFDDAEVLRHLLRHGGRETIMSYGVSQKEFNRSSTEELQALMHERVPMAHRKFLADFEDMIEVGDYLFVHAGIDPARPLEEQRERDLRWIREPFLRHRDDHSHIIVHGHTIAEEIDEQPNRIGIDTGAYRHDRLTALVLEGDTRRYIQAVGAEQQEVAIVHRDAG